MTWMLGQLSERFWAGSRIEDRGDVARWKAERLLRRRWWCSKESVGGGESGSALGSSLDHISRFGDFSKREKSRSGFSSEGSGNLITL